jgi:hypothetical protein
MLVTKDEALTKWCPMSRVAILSRNNDGHLGVPDKTVSCNRGSVDGKLKMLTSCMCIGDKCMLFTQVQPPKPAKGKVILNSVELFYCALSR